MDKDIRGGSDQAISGGPDQYRPTCHELRWVDSGVPRLTQPNADGVHITAELGGDEAHIWSSLA